MDLLQRIAGLMLAITLLSLPLQAQNPTQTVRGRITDQESLTSLPGATVIVMGSNPVIGAVTDVDGNFRLEHVPVGRVSLLITFIGYENKALPNILVTSGKETVLEISMEEAVTMMDAIEVRADADKSQVANEMALTSARSFSVEETKRYAGSFNDPARMASSFAGVDVDPGGNNSIIVRGNSPKGIQWRLEGIEIPNPNHFSDEGATGGPINMLNSQMLANSEFYTGAFSPEYGNALSGVFDMKMRKGNNEHREYSLSIGILGTDASMEGPFVKGGRSSYLINYRYSTLAILSNLGVVDFDGVPKYQDLSYKINIPTKSLGTFSIFGLGGKSSIHEEELVEEQVVDKGDYKSEMGVTGITQYWPLSSRTYLQNSISYSQNGSGYLSYIQHDSQDFIRDVDFDLSKNTIKVASTLNHKFNARHNLQTGVILTRHSFDFFVNSFNEEHEEYVTDQSMEGKANHFQGFVSWKYRPLEDVSIVTGMHLEKISLNDKLSIEPRASIKWQFHPSQALSAGFGIHGRMESLINYYSIVPSNNDVAAMPNQALGLSKARHYVVGYENKISQNLFLKIEGYYQQLYDIPVENDPTSSYSLINQIDGYTDRSLVNAGTGRNVGVELTLERYFADNYYFLLTTSLFDSKYKAMDNIERNTLFNGNYVANLLVGKEWNLSSRKGKKKVISANVKLSSLAGRRYTPILLDESIAKHETVYDESKIFIERGDNILIANLAVSYRIDNKKLSQELKLDIQNATGNRAVLGYTYNDHTQKIETYEQLPLLPVMMYIIHF